MRFLLRRLVRKIVSLSFSFSFSFLDVAQNFWYNFENYSSKLYYAVVLFTVVLLDFHFSQTITRENLHRTKLFCLYRHF